MKEVVRQSHVRRNRDTAKVLAGLCGDRSLPPLKCYSPEETLLGQWWVVRYTVEENVDIQYLQANDVVSSAVQVVAAGTVVFRTCNCNYLIVNSSRSLSVVHMSGGEFDVSIYRHGKDMTRVLQ